MENLDKKIFDKLYQHGKADVNMTYENWVTARKENKGYDDFNTALRELISEQLIEFLKWYYVNVETPLAAYDLSEEEIVNKFLEE